MNNYIDLLNLIIKEIPIKSEDIVYGISFVGSPGIGKSTISKMLSDKMNVYVTANDKIRRILDENGIDASNNQELVEKLAYDRTKYMLENRTSMIIDANVLTAYKLVEENFANYGAKIYFVKLECSENEILKRLDYRETQFGNDKDNYSRATKDDYYKYLKRLENNPFPKNKIYFTINTEKDLDKQIDELVEKIKKNIFNK